MMKAKMWVVAIVLMMVLAFAVPAIPVLGQVHSLSHIGAPRVWISNSAVPADKQLTPNEVQQAYNESGLLNVTNGGQGVTIAIIDTYASEESQVQLTRDYANFSFDYKLPMNNLKFLYYPGVYSNASGFNQGWGIEDALDVQWAHAMAPNANILMVFAPSPTSVLYKAAGYVIANHLANVISMSWGEASIEATTDGDSALFEPSLALAVTNHISVLSASGDCGAYNGYPVPSTNYPSDSPHITSVGGTTLKITQTKTGRVYRLGEYAWNGTTKSFCSNGGGSGGGYGPFVAPQYQAALGLTLRGLPDVSADAITFANIVYHGFPVGVGGTSLSSPMWAGIIATLDSARGSPFGFINPYLYGVYNSSSNYSRAFFDIVAGQNGYPATVGWDPVTGLGTPNVGFLAYVLLHVVGSPGGPGFGQPPPGTGPSPPPPPPPNPCPITGGTGACSPFPTPSPPPPPPPPPCLKGPCGV